MLKVQAASNCCHKFETTCVIRRLGGDVYNTMQLFKENSQSLVTLLKDGYYNKRTNAAPKSYMFHCNGVES